LPFLSYLVPSALSLIPHARRYFIRSERTSTATMEHLLWLLLVVMKSEEHLYGSEGMPHFPRTPC
jgi:hypothetical protein